MGLLVDDGALDPSQTLVEHFPEWRDTPKEAITLRMMLSMRSGLDGTRFMLEGSHIEDGLEMDLIADPGSLWLYSNNGVDLLGLLLDRVTDPNEQLSQAALLFERLLATIPAPEGANTLRDRLDTLKGLAEAQAEVLGLPDGTGAANTMSVAHSVCSLDQ